MKRKYLVIVVLIAAGVVSITFNNMDRFNKENAGSKTAVCEETNTKETNAEEKKEIDTDDKDRKIDIARNLVNDYINKRASSYKINQINFVKNIDDSQYTVDVCYDVKADGNINWIA